MIVISFTDGTEKWGVYPSTPVGRFQMDSQTRGSQFFSLSVLVILVFGVSYFWRLQHPTATVFERQMLELRQFQAALALYRCKYGVDPPDATEHQIVKHLQESYPSIDVKLIRKFDLDSLGERESLYFWLEGSVLKDITGHTDKRYEMYEFDSARLVDDDNDGWPEYLDDSGNCFVLRQGKPLIVDRDSGNPIRIHANE